MAKLNGTASVLINIYNANTKLEQLKTLSDLLSILHDVKVIQNKNIVFEGDFKIYLVSISNSITRVSQQNGCFSHVLYRSFTIIYFKRNH